MIPDEWYIALRHYWIALRTNATPMLEKGLAKKKLPSREMVAVSSNERRIAEAEDPEIWKDAVEKLDEAAEKSEEFEAGVEGDLRGLQAPVVH
ncbi:hypothetical protein ABVK25_004431 [Lepraria finkii]|uniref:Uncharacterized protein n=1 Tax=Lepraria finkii TaxID=1340010 RepID=A0ABR4BB65_9LECA